MKERVLYFFCAATILCLAACDNTKHLAPGQSLYVGSEVKVKSDDNISKSDKKALQSEMTSLIRPQQNSKVLGVRFKLTMYNLVDTPKGKGLRYFIKNKLGEPPVIASYSVLDKDRVVMQNRLENKGYFKDTVTLDTIVKNRKFTGVFTANVHKQYTMRNIAFPRDSSVLSRSIRGRDSTQRRALSQSLLKSDDPYDLDIIKAERVRIDAKLKNRGFYYFGPDYLYAHVDSTVGDHKVDLDMQVKEETPAPARRQYRIGNIIVYADYDVNSDTSLANARKYSGYTIVDPNHRFNPKMFVRTLVFDSGDLYKRDAHNLSLNRLTTLGVYKFVKARFLPNPNVDSLLDAYYYLTPTQKKSLRLQISGLTKDNNSNGGEVAVSWRNRSLFKGAELLTITAYGGIEKQVSGGTSKTQVDTRRGGVEANLYIPRVIPPFFNTNGGFVPHTKITLAYELFNRSTQYLLSTYRGSYGWVWKDNIVTENQFNILNISSVQTANITTEFQDSLDKNTAQSVILRRRLEKQFIIGPSYNFNYSTLNKPNAASRTSNFYFNGNIDWSAPFTFKGDTTTGKEKTLFGTPLSQYIRVEPEFRYTYKLGTYSSFNARVLGGYGYAYGNNTFMPYIKAFFAGGTSDIRAFRSRLLGPGTYYGGNPRDSFLADQPGDIKFEVNAEYRAKLFSIVRGALFVDAGNVWTRNDDPSRPGAKFNSQFLSQMAVGVGAGLRFDVSILVLRLDLAFPVRVPYGDQGPHWVLNQIDFTNKDWRRNNLVFNLAIGYPF